MKAFRGGESFTRFSPLLTRHARSFHIHFTVVVIGFFPTTDTAEAEYPSTRSRRRVVLLLHGGRLHRVFLLAAATRATARLSYLCAARLAALEAVQTAPAAWLLLVSHHLLSVHN
jgi:hypothetical protein